LSQIFVFKTFQWKTTDSAIPRTRKKAEEPDSECQPTVYPTFLESGARSMGIKDFNSVQIEVPTLSFKM
jgi:hypothetical protein